MRTAFRNVEVDPTAPVDTWPYEALVTVVERGTLTDWLVLTRAIDDDPWGVVARQVEHYLSYEAPYGVGPLLTRAIARSRRETEGEERAEVAAEVRDLVTRSGLGMAELAGRVGTSRTRLSTYRSGRVVPSATMMTRIRRTVRRLEAGGPVPPGPTGGPSASSSRSGKRELPELPT